MTRSQQIWLYTHTSVSVLAGALKVLDTVFTFLGKRYEAHLHGRGPVKASGHKLTATAAARLFQGGKLFDTLLTVASLLLRSVRRGPLKARISEFGFVQRAACRNLCFAVTHVFEAIYALDDWEGMLHRLPVRLIPTVACLACDNMSPSDDAALGLVRLLSDSRLLGGMDAEDPIRVLRCPAMKHLVRRMLPLALATLQHADLQTVTDHLRAVHQELNDDELLSEHIRMSEMWPQVNPDITTRTTATSGRATANSSSSSDHQMDETSGAYLVPRVQDNSLQEFLALLRKRSITVQPKKGPALRASDDSVHTARILATLLSLQQTQAEIASPARQSSLPLGGARQLSDFEMQDALLTAGRYVSALSVRLLHALQAGHVGCACELTYEGEGMEEGWDEPRGAVRRACYPCSALAEAVTAILLQLVRLHESPDARKTDNTEGELDQAGFQK